MMLNLVCFIFLIMQSSADYASIIALKLYAHNCAASTLADEDTLNWQERRSADCG